MWHIRADTGGTFTDCWGRHGDDPPILVKVLSSGSLRIAISETRGAKRFRLAIPAGWQVPDGFFTGFRVRSGNAETTATSWKAESALLETAEELPFAPALELTTGEEAPVLGARLLTGTSLSQSFPPLEFRLATTRGTNALLERKIGRVAFFTTRGFRDLLLIGDQRRPDLFALEHHRRHPLYEEVVEIEERLDAGGTSLFGPTLDDAFDASARRLLANGIQTAAVALLHSYRNPGHEEAVRDRLLALGFTHVSLSSALAPLIRFVPRAQTAVANACLEPVMRGFLDRIAAAPGDDGSLLTMTSAGGLEPLETYHPKDALLSGPAGGVAGAAAIARELGEERILTFDMGGTSTDVARYDGDFLYRFEQRVGDAHLLSPALKIETVAAGGGSICRWTENGLRVGPESAGADPGPACYGKGGPLTVTDVNLLLGRIDPDNFGIPLPEEHISAARSRAMELQEPAGIESDGPDRAFLEGLLAISVEQMADAIRTISIRDGADPADHALLAFGGAGPLHACDIAERLGMTRILVPAEAGLLSAFGLDQAVVERFAERQVNRPLGDPALAALLETIQDEAREKLAATGFPGRVARILGDVRLAGQDATLTLELTSLESLSDEFARLYRDTYGYAPPPDRILELVSLRAIARTERPPPRSTGSAEGEDRVESRTQQGSSTGTTGSPHPPYLDRAGFQAGEQVEGPAIVQDPFSTLFLTAGWKADVAANGSLVCRRDSFSTGDLGTEPAEVTRELFRHRFDQIVVEMGTMLQRSAISTNVKERADFSCALLDAEGRLVTNAPHIPVHLGALGLCVRKVREEVAMQPGDTIVTNHPGFGGSHLPDVTLITPVFTDEGALLGYVANRAHHADIGGTRPGSMPPDARTLEEEGVTISPTHLVRGGESCLDQIERLLTAPPHPARSLSDNLADLNAQLAANYRGSALLRALASEHGTDEIGSQLFLLCARSHEALRLRLATSDFDEARAVERLDDGTTIAVHLRRSGERLAIDFSGTEETHPGNLHATPAIIQSAILYVLRLWSATELPLNEGVLDCLDIVLPHCFLNPRFSSDPHACPAVVGGNVETSQRVVDALVRALGIQAGSQGTMNNFLFGNDSFGYYETIGGGAGAGPGYDGASGIHTHMTNTAITDPEILEARYPVRLLRFGLRAGSGGAGRWHGGEGIVREIEFLDSLQVSLLSQHRASGAFGLEGGAPGAPGRQFLNGVPRPGIDHFEAQRGDRYRIETPGGGGWGEAGSTGSAV